MCENSPGSVRFLHSLRKSEDTTLDEEGRHRPRLTPGLSPSLCWACCLGSGGLMGEGGGGREGSTRSVKRQKEDVFDEHQETDPRMKEREGEREKGEGEGERERERESDI